jgi:hypothetical protein
VTGSRTRTPFAAAALLSVLAIAGCAGSSGGTLAGSPPSSAPSPSASPIPSCSPPAGGRCPGPLPIPGPLAVDSSGTHLSGYFLCGGTLAARESSQQVDVTYKGSAVRAGGMACARVQLTVALAQPLGSRSVIDTATGKHVTVTKTG